MSFIEDSDFNYSKMLHLDESPSRLKNTYKVSNDSGYFSSPVFHNKFPHKFVDISMPSEAQQFEETDQEESLEEADDITSILASIPKCVGCGQSIFDKEYFQIKNDTWHEKCLQCCECLRALDTRAYFRDNSVYCEEHYLPTFVTNCKKCKQSVSMNEVVRKAGDNVYHVRCFKCLICDKALNTGDPFYLTKDNKLVCNGNHDQIYARDDVEHTENKRPRSIITNKQQEALDRVYSQNAKPPRHVREYLSKSTGLDMRVVQVWFQNRRAKDKRTQRQMIDHKWRGCDGQL